MPLITLTTDFGLADPFVAMMKGVILSIAPGCTIVDVSHEVPAGDVMAGALMLEAADYFPAGTIHVAVVDPGVGGQRKAIAVETDEAVFVGPDNGIFTLAMARKTVHRVDLMPRRGSFDRVPWASEVFRGSSGGGAGTPA